MKELRSIRLRLFISTKTKRPQLLTKIKPMTEITFLAYHAGVTFRGS